MPYQRLSQLPDQVRDNLPDHAQDIYKETYNDACQRYSDPDDRRGDDSREDVARKLAWSAVKQSYERRDGRWVRKD